MRSIDVRHVGIQAMCTDLICADSLVACDVLTKSKRNKCFTFSSLHLWSIMTGLRNTWSCVLNTVQQRWITKWPKGIRGLASMNKTEIKNRGAKIFQNSSSQLKIIGAREVTRSNFHTVGPHTLRTTNSAITTIRRPRFSHPSCKIHFSSQPKRRSRKLTQAPKLLKRSRGMYGSNLTLDSDYPCWGSPYFQFITASAGAVLQLRHEIFRPQPFPFTVH